jgi:DNA-binding GntR family transcriptional regulator
VAEAESTRRPRGAPGEIVTATSLADEIGFRLEKAILEGEYRPGTHLLQDELCERFGVSRTPIREALRKLQAQHLVVLVPNKGATVRIPSQVELQEIYAIRAEIEGFACALAAPHVTDDTIRQLDAAQELIDAAHAAAAGDMSADEEARVNSQITLGNEEFHAIIHRTAGNNHLQELCRSYQSFFPKDYVWRAIRFSPEATHLNIEEHQQIRAGLAARDSFAAREAMSNHILHGGRLLMDYLAHHGFWA